jgi:hypothetical protein
MSNTIKEEIKFKTGMLGMAKQAENSLMESTNMLDDILNKAYDWTVRFGSDDEEMCTVIGILSVKRFQEETAFRKKSIDVEERVKELNILTGETNE